MTDERVWCEAHGRAHPPGMGPCPPPAPRSSPPPPVMVGPSAQAERVSTDGWTPVGAHRRQAVMVVLAQARAAASAIVAAVDDGTLETAMHRMLLAGDDTIRATAYAGAKGGQPMWCEVHARDLRDCHRSELTCSGAPYHPGLDPVGETAAGHVDQGAATALRDLRATTHALRSLTRVAIVAATAVEDYRSRAGVSSGAPSPEWCSNHEAAGFATEEIARNTDERKTPKYRAKRGGYLCSWCGTLKAAHGDEPPAGLVRMKETRGRVKPSDVAAAYRAIKKRKRR